MVEESPRQKLFRLTHIYLKEQYAAHTLRCIEEEYRLTASGPVPEDYIRHWYAQNGFTRIKRAIQHFFPETDDQVLRESPAIWQKYQAVLAWRREKGCTIEAALGQLSEKKITEEEIRHMLDSKEPEKTDAPEVHVSALKFYGSSIWETVKGVCYRLTHWK
jgi:hypothetical protein